MPTVALGPRGGGRQLSSLAKLTSVGLEFSISVLLGLFGGRWIDGKLGSEPWLMILGLALGVTAGLRSLIRTARQASEQLESDNRKKNDD